MLVLFYLLNTTNTVFLWNKHLVFYNEIYYLTQGKILSFLERLIEYTQK